MTDQLDFLAPHSQESEESLLGALLMNPGHIDDVLLIVQPSDLFFLRNQWILEAIIAVHNDRDLAVTNITVQNELDNRGQLKDIGDYVTYLINNCPSSLYSLDYATIIERASVRRRILAAAGEIAKLANDPDLITDEICDAAESALFSVTARHLQSSLPLNFEVGRAAIEDLSKRVENADKGLPVGIPVGYAPIDSSGIFQPGELSIVAGRSRTGKSGLAANFALGAVKKDVHVGYATFEMGTDAVYRRLIGIETGLNTQLLKLGKLSREQYGLAVESGNRIACYANLHWNTQNGMSFERFRSWVRSNAFDLVIVDYLEPSMISPPVSAKSDNTERAYSALGYGLLNLARELNVCIIALAQLNREAFDKKNRPQLQHIRYSDALQHAANVVLIWDVPALRGDDSIVCKHDDLSAVSAVAYFDKVRDGPTPEFNMVYIRSCQRIELAAVEKVDL